MNWREEAGGRYATRGHWSGSFSIYEDRRTGKCVLTSGAPMFAGPFYTDTLDEAKAKAAALSRPEEAPDA